MLAVVGIPSRDARPSGSDEDTLSQELRTAGLLRPHVLVGYQWSHTGFCPGDQTSHNMYIRSFGPHPPKNGAETFGLMRLKPLPRPLAGPGGAQALHLHDTGPGLTSGIRRRPHQQRGCRHLLCLPSQFLGRSGAEPPEGSRPAFAGGDLARGAHPLSVRLPSGVRFLPRPLPAVPSATALRRAYLKGRTTGLSRSTEVSRMV